MSQTLGETMMASFMASTKEIPDIFILVVVEGLTPLPLGVKFGEILLRPMERTVASGSEGDGAGLNSVPT